MRINNIVQFVLDHVHVHHLTVPGVALFAAKFAVKFAAKRLALAAAKRLTVWIVPRHLLERFAPTWLPAKTKPAELPPAETAAPTREPERR